MKRTLAALLCTAACVAGAQAACPPEGQTRDSLLTLRNAKWAVDDAARREALALGLLDCLADPDPALRDEVAYEGLQWWMRSNALSPAVVRRLANQLLGRVTPRAAASDARGVAAPFAALTLAEVARVDRLTPIYSPAEREGFVNAAISYLASVRDYRGFDPREGWRHGVAHGADWLLQLSLNTALDKPQLDRMLAAIAAQAVPPGEHSYVHGEGQRLMAPVFYIAKRGLHDAGFWTGWLGRIAAAGAWPEGHPINPTSLARMHNARGFIWPLYAAVQETPDDAQRERLLPGLKAALKSLQ
jgi:hypothetical protein